MKWKTHEENWRVIKSFLPKGWQEQAKELGALTRQRKVKNASDLLRVLLIHVADGCSLRETAARGRQGRISDISDVALLKRLKGSSEWFRWMAMQLLRRRGIGLKKPSWLSGYNVRSVDASTVSEPGSTGTDWRLHYSLELFGLRCDQFILTEPNVGESFKNFDMGRDDLIIGDRAYGRLQGLWHVRRKGGEFLVRLRNKAFPLYNPKSGKNFHLLPQLRKSKVGQAGEWMVEARGKKHPPLPMRLCVVRKSKAAAEEAIKRARREMRKQETIDPETLELHRFVILATSLPSKNVSAYLVTELYRIRWQIEIAFKRLKSIMGLGHLPKSDAASCRAWLHGKLFVALLVQAIIDEGRFFSPWGYRLNGRAS